ncbi:MAG: response regulator [Alphaproteobacteria bacterium]
MRILIVDDQGGALDVVVSVLRALGFPDVHRVTSGEEGIAYLTAHRVDLIIVDLSCGSSKHVALARFLSEHEDPAVQEIPLILLSRPALGAEEIGEGASDVDPATGGTADTDSLMGQLTDIVGRAAVRDKKKRILH